MISFDEAFARVAEAARPLERERVPLEAAHGRVLAAPVVAAVDSPPANVSAMDGYAAREADLGAPLRLIGESFPGAGFGGTVGAGECVRIFTGAPVPSGADRVIVQEIVRRDGDIVRVTGSFSASRHIRVRGSDFSAGDTLLKAGRQLNAGAMVAAAGADCSDVEAWRQPRIAILGTGDELAAAGTARSRPGSIPESVSFGIAALAAEWGGEVIARERLPDDPSAIRAAAEQALQAADLVVMTGGASVGEKDYAKGVFAALGLDPIFTKVAIRPGKPVWFGRIGQRLVMGLPGNPTSAMVTARLLMAPLVVGLGGRDPAEAARWRRASLGSELDASSDRETFTRGRWMDGVAEPLSNQESGAQRALAEAEVLIRRGPGAPAAAVGAEVEVIDF